MSNMPPARRITLCADDYGMTAPINAAIRELIVRGRLNATSVMMVGGAIDRAEARALVEAARAAERCTIGLHVTLTAPFNPLTMYFRPLEGGAFLPLKRLMRASLLRRLDSEIIRQEIAAQFAAFADRFSRLPDHVDGHQHVQLFPQVRDAFLAAVKAHAPQAQVRQCGRAGGAAAYGKRYGKAYGNPKALLLDRLSRSFRVRCERHGLACNPAFAGAYDFSRPSEFGPAMAGFLSGLPDGGLVMCHPGHVDATLAALDSLTDQREREYAYLMSDDFPRLLAAQGATLS